MESSKQNVDFHHYLFKDTLKNIIKILYNRNYDYFSTLKWKIKSSWNGALALNRNVLLYHFFLKRLFSSYIVLQLGKRKNIIECKHIYLMTAVYTKQQYIFLCFWLFKYCTLHLVLFSLWPFIPSWWFNWMRIMPVSNLWEWFVVIFYKYQALPYENRMPKSGFNPNIPSVV